MNCVRYQLCKSYMKLFSNIGKPNEQWEGYCEARHKDTPLAKQDCYLKVAEIRYRESRAFPLDAYFGTDLKQFLIGKDVLEIGSNYGGAALDYVESYQTGNFTGVDKAEDNVAVSNRFFNEHGVMDGFTFVNCHAERLPFADASFDAILSFDTFEHVKDVSATLRECYRALRSGGRLFAVFPSFWHPTQHHLVDVTSAPCVHWFFPTNVIMQAYWDIFEENPTHMERYGTKKRELLPWEKSLLLNGVTSQKFRKWASDLPWGEVKFINLPMGAAGKVASSKKVYRLLSFVLRPFSGLPFLEEALLQRIVCILRK